MSAAATLGARWSALDEKRKTAVYAAAAVLLGGLALATQPRPPTPEAFADRGETFFPAFTDPNTATSLEVIDYDPATGAARPFKVQFAGGRWTIPSHHDHPADGKDRLARTAAAVITLRKDDVRSDNTADHAACGVIDPLDESSTAVEGRGQHVTLKGADGATLADLVVGAAVPGREGYRFVRLPGQKRVYACKMEDVVSTRFQDWIEKDLLQLARTDIGRVEIDDYSIDERTGMVDRRDNLVLTKEGETWSANRMGSGQEVDRARMNDMLGALDELEIVGVRPKPEGLSRTLAKTEGAMISYEDMLSLRSRGYYFARDGNLLSNEGEVRVRSSQGVIYTLRFGEVVYGTGEAVSAGVDSLPTGGEGPGENRYLFITTAVDPANPGGDAAKISDALNARFADWYYVIPSSAFDKLRVSRKDLIQKKPA